MSQIKTQKDWTALEVGRFWDWMNQTKRVQYFSEGIGDGLVKFFGQHISLKGDVLDFGCGTGYFLSKLPKQCTLHGLDFSFSSVDSAKALLASKANLGEVVFVQDLPSSFPTDKFDVIFLIETIEHLNDFFLDSVLQELHRLLKPGGRLVITTPHNEDIDAHTVYCPFCDSEFHHMQHMQKFTVQSMTELLKKYHFNVLNCFADDLYKYQFPVKYAVKELGKLVLNPILKLNKPPFLKPNLVAIVTKDQ